MRNNFGRGGGGGGGDLLAFLSVTFPLLFRKTFDCNLVVQVTPSLPQSVKFPGRKIHTLACKQCSVPSYSKSLSILSILMEAFHTLMRKKKKKMHNFKFHFHWSVFKRHPSSEKVKEHFRCSCS